MSLNDRIRRIVDEGKFVVVNSWDDVNEVRDVDLRAARGNVLHGKVEGDIFDAAWCYPASLKESILEVVRVRAELLGKYKDSMALVYELNNRIARGEL